MELSRVEGFSHFLRLKCEWSDLLARCDNDSLFLTHEWLCTWWECYGKDRHLMVLLLRQDGKLIGVAPFAIAQETIRGIPVRRIIFMGDSEWTPGSLIMATDEKPAIPDIIDYLMSLRWDMIDLKNIPLDSEELRILPPTLASRSLRNIISEASRSPCITIAGSWESFLNGKSGKFKKVLRNKLNRVGKIKMDIKKYSAPAEMAEALPIIFELSTKSWKQEVANAISSTEANRVFYTRLSETFSNLGLLDIWVLFINGTPAAFEYHLRHGNKIHAVVADYHPNFKELSPGSVLEYHILQQIFNNANYQGYEYDMGSGVSFYKTNWTEDVKKHARLRVYNNSLRSTALYHAEKTVVPLLKAARDVVADHFAHKTTQ